MNYHKEIALTILSVWLFFFPFSAFGFYTPSKSEMSLNFDFQTPIELDENKMLVLLFNDGEKYCIIPSNTQDMKRLLDTEKILKQDIFVENFFTFEQIQDLNLCHPEVAHIVWNSINKKADQEVAIKNWKYPNIVGVFVAYCILMDLCGMLHSVSN